ncbi:unnamed protein product [Heligmosomoides polygyrus]|uniref:Uncharacterized protein n=1 Tax=Heligmosomoides polygyrus TaxID=6339 RepID=A0A3P8AS37_HELPZ|nr:unnamed protein product [Heligmosomoides polygyrus]
MLPDNTVRQGISSRCGYTGGDRASCSKVDGCSSISVFDGMTGNVRNVCNEEKYIRLETKSPPFLVIR